MKKKRVMKKVDVKNEKVEAKLTDVKPVETVKVEEKKPDTEVKTVSKVSTVASPVKEVEQITLSSIEKETKPMLKKTAGKPAVKKTATKPAVKKTTAKPVEKKITDVKATDKVNLDEKTTQKNVATSDKTAVKKTTDKPATKKTAVKAAEKKIAAKAADQKTVTKVAKKTTTKTATNTSVYFQYGGVEITAADMVEKAKAAYIAEGHTAASVKSIRLYIKPEDNTVYYVINDTYTSSVSIL